MRCVCGWYVFSIDIFLHMMIHGLFMHMYVCACGLGELRYIKTHFPCSLERLYCYYHYFYFYFCLTLFQNIYAHAYV
jgi:hypothetical protein